MRSLFSLLLTDIGALVVACADGEEVQRVVTSRFCQLFVFVQGAMPDTGECVAAVRRASPDTRVLLIANRDDVDSVIPLFSQGLSDALLQPINPKRAVASIQRLMGQEKAVVASAGAPTGGPVAASAEGGYRPTHLTAHSAAMRRVLDDLWNARNDPIGVVLRGEAGVEFELAAREYQAMGGDAAGGLVVLSYLELDVDTLATQLSLDRLHEGVPRTYFVSEVEKLPKAQIKPLLEFLRRSRRMRDREKPLRIVFASNECDDEGRTVDSEFLEELQFVMPAVVKLPALRDRRDDVEPIVRRIIADLTAIFPENRARTIHPSAMQWLVSRAWRGNYRELLGVVRAAVMECSNRELSAVHFGRLVEAGLGKPDPEEQAAARVLAAATRAVLD